MSKSKFPTIRIDGDVAILNDFHFGVRNDHQGFMKLQEEFLVTQFFPYLKKHRITKIFIAGDLFDRRKYISFATFDFARRVFFDVCRDEGIEVYAIPGNHDITYKNTLRINSLDLLLKDYDNVHVFLEPVTFQMDDFKIGFVPWICSENEEDVMEYIQTTEATRLLGHFEISGFQMYRGQVIEHGMSSSIFSHFEAVYSGHYHHKSSIGNIHYLGSQMEFTWSDYNDQKGFHVLRGTGEMDYVKNPKRMFYKIVYDDANNDYSKKDFSYLKNRFVKLIVSKKTKPELYDSVYDAIQNAGCYDFKTIDGSLAVVEDVSPEKVEDTMTLISETVDNIPGIGASDKEDIKAILARIYNEAQHGDDE